MSIESLSSTLANLGIKDEIKSFEGSNPTGNPFDIFRSYIATELATVSEIPAETIYSCLETTSKVGNGDLILPVPRLRLKAKPADLAAQWAEKFPTSSLISQATSNGVFLQFFFNTKVLNNLVIPSILHEQKTYGTNKSGAGKKVIVEFSSPNIAKPFHAGHLRSTIIGSFLANLHEACGWDVVKMNYLGDWGKQFGLLAIGFEKYGTEEELKEDPIKHLYDVYVKINAAATAQEEEIKAAKEAAEKEGKTYEAPVTLHDEARAYFKKMEEGDEAAKAIWARFRDLSISKYVDTYSRLNVHYDVYSGESQVAPESMQKALEIMEEKGIVVKDEGAVLVDLTPYNKKLGKAIIQKKDGTTLYLTRDIGAAAERYEKYKFDKMIYVVASQQDLHLNQLFKILELMGYEWASKCVHINFGMVTGMSTRKGTAVFLDQILETAKENMHDVMKKNEVKYAQVEDPDYIADVVGISAVMVQDMAAKRINNYAFEWSRMLTFEGDTGPYLQYAHARLCSVERKSGYKSEDTMNSNYDLLVEQQASDLIRILAQYPDVVNTAMKTQEPSAIVTYLFKMSHVVSSCYDVLWVANQEPALATARLSLYLAARQVLSNGMELLGLKPVQRM
ncbi:arginyl-tRNA synthetase [Saitoella complicata NRRL Y-17804]|uniref:arginine--tRNA ligase n=1 Tax=Saitoella complicata (strain BCRC 22490 / CBS 7301 / JCM 7358 / NBRC 10748 / NRRL Y-17804) TaxID=698492 RepID=A0A0E9NG18_SAICN|nr:arginyl-tRNA synthetase [Saitoella complicata NRRL Y-17804]ODQ53641.1 arginyl-tRNA synthetase [Saitoella complicata NRRL Y-17804]GAO48817.1 hypothetical protein G7K_2986-t1 [Saitoella complicata NRRL Y-17804]